MPILTATNLRGRIEAVLVNPDRGESLESQRVAGARVSFAGLEGDTHAGLTRESCVRVRSQYPRGTEIRNTRQLSIVSVEDLATIARKLDIESVEPEWVGANLVVSGIPRFTLVPPSSRLIASTGTSLVVDMENAPCVYPGEVIEKHHAGRGKAFAKAARQLRGVTAWVEREGELQVGDELTLHVPPQRIYDLAL